ncbi:hypothetical protein [Clostridium gasigenes]|nr:hypothetical protein [Clostridium gasigenes]MBU3102567.1 hypothetical protein [Clostridium gasigenes]
MKIFQLRIIIKNLKKEKGNMARPYKPIALSTGNISKEESEKRKKYGR